MTVQARILFGMLLGLAATAAIIALLMGQAKADGECFTQAQIRSDILASFPNASLATIGKNNLPNFLAAFNAEPPQTDAKADVIILVQDKSLPAINVLFFLNDCMHGRGTITPEQLLRFMGNPT